MKLQSGGGMTPKPVSPGNCHPDEDQDKPGLDRADVHGIEMTSSPNRRSNKVSCRRGEVGESDHGGRASPREMETGAGKPRRLRRPTAS